ncbi:MAG TPA: methyltransferase domain-containing protein, partial [Dehalococcoidia bacterium]|nr:methyltransferase domain-containing protein [Dehalococcoidia bacterium]
MTDSGVRRLNWGCGEHGAPGWLNADLVHGPGIEISGDIRHGLPLDDECIDYAFSSHALQQLPYLDVEPALRELRRVLKPGGVLRLGLPDLDRALLAWRSNDTSYFYVPDEDARTIAGKLIVQMTWYGSSPMLFNYEFAEEMLQRASFRNIRRCTFRTTASRF